MLVSILVILLVVFLVFLLLRCCLCSKRVKPNFFLRPFTRDPDWVQQLDLDDLCKQSFGLDKLKRKKYDIIYVGSGLSALSGASLASQLGMSVLILEQNEQLGGMCHTFVEDGFEFSAGVHFMLNMRGVQTLYDRVSEKRLKFALLAPETNFTDVVSFLDEKTGSEDEDEGELSREPAVTIGIPSRSKGGARQAALDMFGTPDRPDLVSQINAFWDDAARAVRELSHLMMVRYSVPAWLRGIVIWFLETFKGVKIFRLASVSYLDYLRSRFPGSDLASERIVSMYARWGVLQGRIEEVNAQSALMGCKMSDICGKDYPVGGASSVVTSIMKTVVKHGGEGYCFANVTEILLDDDDRAVGVRVGEDSIVRSKYVVSCCGIANTFSLLPARVRPKKLAEFSEPSVHFLIGFLGFDASLQELGLPDSDICLLQNKAARILPDISSWETLSDSPDPPPLIYLGNANPVHCPKPGCSGLVVILYSRWEHFDRWKGFRIRQRGSEYEEEKELAFAGARKVIYRNFPKLEEHLVFESLATPLSSKHWTAWPTGESYGATDKLRRLEMYDQCVKQPGGVRGGLLVSGTDSMPGPGLGYALMAGLLTTAQISGNANFMQDLFDATRIMLRRKKKKQE